MIQRIQSIWLLFAAIAATLTYKFEFYSGINVDHPNMYKITGLENIPIILLTSFISVLALITIFLYKNRKLQIRLCYAGILLELLLLALYYLQIQKYNDGGTISIWVVLHGLIIVLFALAARNINKDEKLIRDSDRLR